jgi:hypothetical protein
VVGVAVLAFVAAFGLAWYLFAPPPAPVESAPAVGRLLGEGEIESFLSLVRTADFQAIAQAGQELFHPGDRVASNAQFAFYEVGSYPPYQVYAFFTTATPEWVRRILLTLDEGGRVESFMAEEMPVIP